MHMELKFIFYIDGKNLELFLLTQELIFGFPVLYPDKNVTVTVDDNKIIFISETGQTHELGTSEVILDIKN